MFERRVLWVVLALVGCTGGDESNTGFMTVQMVSPTTPMTTTGDDTTSAGPADDTTTTPTTPTTTDPTPVLTTGGDPVCGDGVVEGDEACDDGNADNTDACLTTCVAASCGDTFVHVGVEACDGGTVVVNGTCSMCQVGCTAGFADCNGDLADGCELPTSSDPANCGGCGTACAVDQTCADSVCVAPVIQQFGPVHSFVGQQSDYFITQGCCSLACNDGDAAGMADYFCKRFYNAGCTAEPGWVPGPQADPAATKMHFNDGCTSQGVDIPGTTCEAGPCKIGAWSEQTSGLSNLVCACP